MKIVEIKPWLVETSFAAREYLFVEVITDEGISGWGEITTYPGPVANRAVAGILGHLTDLLKGDDPARIEAIWNKVFRSFTYVGTRGAVSAVTSAIDIALWDIRGKVLDLPVCELLGGRVRETIRADMSEYNAFIDHPLDVRDGDLYLSERPGLGIEIDLDYIKANALPGFGR